MRKPFGRTAAAALCVALAAAIAAPATALADHYGFTDIPADHWAATSRVIDYAVDRGLLGGYGNGEWGPDDTLTRGQMAVIMYRICAPEDETHIQTMVNSNDRPFNNLNGCVEGRYYGNAMNWAYTEGLIKGNGYISIGDGYVVPWGTWYANENDCRDYCEPYVRPDDDITREELAVMLVRLAQHRGDYDAADADYAALDAMPDASSVSNWARECVAWAVGKGIITGSNGCVNPQGSATRAEAAKMLLVYLKGEGFDLGEHERVWVDGQLYTSTPYWICSTVFGSGCGATSDVSKDAIQHKPSCGIYRGETVLIGESYTDYRWVSLGEDSSQGDYARKVAKNLGILEGWYDYV